MATFWSNLTAGVSGVARIAAYDPANEEVQIAAEVKGFEPRDYMDFKEARRMSRFAQFAVAAAAQAIEDVRPGDHRRQPRRIAVVINTGGGGIGDVTADERVYLEQGPQRVSPFMVPMLSPHGRLPDHHPNRLRGPVVTSVAACAAGVQAFIEAQRMIERGEADVVVTGGTEAPSCRSPSPRWRTWAPSPSATTSPRVPPARSTPRATASSSARAPR